MRRTIFTISLLLLSACAPTVGTDFTDIGSMDTDGETEGTDGDDTSTSETAGSSGSDSNGGSSGSSSSTGTPDTDTDGESTGGTDTDGPQENPGPDDLCDPFLAASGELPCENPEFPNQTWTCAPVKLMPAPSEYVWEFRCVSTSDPQGDGSDLGDPCSDASMWYEGGSTGCVNAFCLWNGFTNDPSPVHQNWPANECTFAADGEPSVFACCSSYCDDDNPCDPGWSCRSFQTVGSPVVSDVGTCVFNG